MGKKDGEQRLYNTISCTRKYTFSYFYEKLIKKMEEILGISEGIRDESEPSQK